MPRRHRVARLGRLLVAMAAIVVLTSCQVDAWVRLEVRPDGSGTVAVDVYLDDEAAARVGDVDEVLVVDDLVAAGWKVTGPAPAAEVARQVDGGGEGSDGSATRDAAGAAGTMRVHLAKPFADVDEANAILASLSGADGPLREVALERRSSMFTTETSFSGTVDLSEGLDVFGDDALALAMGGPLGEVLTTPSGEAPSGDDLTVGLQIVPSGDMDWSGETGNRAMGDDTVAVQASLGSPPRAIDVQSRQTRWAPVGVAATLVVLVLGGLVVIGFSFRRSANRAEKALLVDGGLGEEPADRPGTRPDAPPDEGTVTDDT